MMNETRPQDKPIYPLPSNVHVIYHADHILSWISVNFVQDNRENTEISQELSGCGRFFATACHIGQSEVFLVTGCNSLSELEEKAHQLLFKESSPQSPREHFRNIGKYFTELH